MHNFFVDFLAYTAFFSYSIPYLGEIKEKTGYAKKYAT